MVAGLIGEVDGTFNTALRIYRNDAETYVPIEVIDCPSCEGWWDFTAATWADQDSDGDVDILLAVPGHLSDEAPGSYAFRIPDGHVFFLGDNTTDSHDCRFSDLGDIPVSRVVGPVSFRIWPPSRWGRVR